MKRIAQILSIVLAAAPFLVQAALTPQDTKEVLAYKLTVPVANRILTALPEVTQLVISQPDARARIAKAATASLEERIKDAEASPKTVDLLKQHDLTPRDYIVGVVALRMALMAATLPTANSPGSPIVASPENIAFAKAHPELRPKMEAADRAGIPQRR